MPPNSKIKRTALMALLALLTASCGNNDTAPAASEKDRPVSQDSAPSTDNRHALSSYKKQLDKAKAVQDQLRQHDLERRQALDEAEGASSGDSDNND